MAVASVVARHPLWVSAAGGIVDVEDARLGIGSLLQPGAANTATKTGFRPGPTANATLVTASGTADRNVHVDPFQGYIQSTAATASGTYIVSLSIAATLDLLTSNPSDPTNPRNDLIIGRIYDAYYTGSLNQFTIEQVVGTPSGSPVDPTVTGDYILLARVRVAANATTITTANITDLRPTNLTVGLGGMLPVPSAAVRNALPGKYPGFSVWRVDRKWEEVYDGTGWRVQGIGIVANVADLAAIDAPLAGQWASNLADGYLYSYNGSAWIPRPAGLPTVPTTTGSNGSGTLSSGAEIRDSVLGNYVFTAAAGVRYQVFYCGRQLSGTISGDRFAFRIRNGGASTPTTSSTQVGPDATNDINAGVRETTDVISTFKPGAGTVTLGAFLVRLSGSGTAIPTGICELYAIPIGAV